MILLFLVAACNQRDVLVDNSWILFAGTLHGQPIEFTTYGVVITDPGTGMHLFDFNEDGTIILPGINSGTISARWKTEGDMISFSLDSTRYPFSTLDASIFETPDSVIEARPIKILEEFVEPMRIYGRSFRYSVSRDTLRLGSKDVNLWAVGNHRIDEMLEPIKPRSIFP